MERESFVLGMYIQKSRLENNLQVFAYETIAVLQFPVDYLIKKGTIY